MWPKLTHPVTQGRYGSTDRRWVGRMVSRSNMNAVSSCSLSESAELERSVQAFIKQENIGFTALTNTQPLRTIALSVGASQASAPILLYIARLSLYAHVLCCVVRAKHCRSTASSLLYCYGRTALYCTGLHTVLQLYLIALHGA